MSTVTWQLTPTTTIKISWLPSLRHLSVADAFDAAAHVDTHSHSSGADMCTLILRIESGRGEEEGAKPIIQCSARDLLWNVNRSGYGVNGRCRIEIFDVFFPQCFLQ